METTRRSANALARYDEAVREWHAFRIELERTVVHPDRP
jgi:hypothetical protein